MAELIIVSDKRECHENCTKCTVCVARFVNKDALLGEWNKQSSRGHYEFDQTIMEFPTTTEAEIRAKALKYAQSRFRHIYETMVANQMENCINWADMLDSMVAEQLKEELE